MKQWRKDIAVWEVGKIQYISIPFTWLVDKAIDVSLFKPLKTVFGGPGAILRRDDLDGYGEVREDPGPFDPLLFHNPLATFTTRGCPHKCAFCAVPKIEGQFRIIDDFRPAPVVCDNNFLYANESHIKKVVDALKVFKYVDFNQGLEARMFRPSVATKLSELNCKVRFAFDDVTDESDVMDAITRAKAAGFKDIGCYVLIGFNDTPDDALYRLNLLRSVGIKPNPMRYQPLDAREKNKYVDPQWTADNLRRYMKYWSRLNYYGHIPFEEFRPHVIQQEVFDFGDTK